MGNRFKTALLFLSLIAVISSNDGTKTDTYHTHEQDLPISISYMITPKDHQSHSLL